VAEEVCLLLLATEESLFCFR